MIIHQMQPTSTSCGAACVAMLVGVAVDDVLKEFPKRFSASKLKKLHRGQKITTNKTNVSEMWRLLKGYNRHMGPKREVMIATRMHAPGLLRCHEKLGSGGYRIEWHWLVIADGRVHDPNASGPMDANQWFIDNAEKLTYYYEVE